MSSSSPGQMAIRVEHLSKLYQLNAYQGNLRDQVAYRLKGKKNSSAEEKSKTELWALKDVNFQAQRGEVLGIVGPNGAGKTTILKILSKVVKPTQGSVQVKGRLGALLELGAGFHPDLTGRENIFLFGSILGMGRSEISRRYDEIVAFSGLERFMDTPVKRYSSGMYVRLGFSVAAHTNPEVLLVDEVLAVGDAEFRQKCINQIRALQQEGVCIVFISHNLFQVRSFCNHGIFLKSGEILVDGPVHEAILAYEEWLRSAHPQQEKTYAHLTAGQADGQLYMIGIELVDRKGRQQEQFDYDEPMEMRIHYSARERFTGLHFSIRIIRDDGLLCSTLRSADLGLQLEDIEGQGYVSISLKGLRLASGAYVIEVRLRDATDMVNLSVAGSGMFLVAGPNVSGDPENGIFLPDIGAVMVVPVDEMVFQMKQPLEPANSPDLTGNRSENAR